MFQGEKAADKLQTLKAKTGSALEWWKYKLTVDFIRSRVVSSQGFLTTPPPLLPSPPPCHVGLGNKQTPYIKDCTQTTTAACLQVCQTTGLE